jgi:hypothetical protein
MTYPSLLEIQISVAAAYAGYHIAGYVQDRIAKRRTSR